MVRQVLSFYKLTPINNAHLNSLHYELKAFLRDHGALGRVYVATDGLNAQISIDSEGFDTFENNFRRSFPDFSSVYFNKSPFNADIAFDKLSVRKRPQVVSDDIPLSSLDLRLDPNQLAPTDFHHSIIRHVENADDKKSIFLDIRNSYELEVGNFPKTTLVPAETFREYMVKLRDKILPNYDPESTNVLMVCTGGIRCSKAGLVMRNWGWKRVNMLQGGITRYIRELGSSSLFSGINFTFDNRCGERFTSSTPTVSRCAGCGSLTDSVSNCKNSSCNRMTVQCTPCQSLYEGACGPGCHQIIMHPHLAVMHRQIGAMHNKHHRKLL